MNLPQIIEYLKTDPKFSRYIKHIHELSGKEEVLVDFPEDLDFRIIKALEKRNIRKLYLHQYLAYKEISEGKNVLLTTATASGKTLSFFLPILNQKIKDPKLKALLIYPTKALSRDQENWFQQLCKDLGLKINVYTYDGDTNQAIRKKIRGSGDFIITNPDMLHMSLLSRYTSWIQFFENLSFIIIDEVHTYKGFFGSHFANILRRMFRIINSYNRNPQIIAASATIGNPKELIEKLTEKEFVIIDQDFSKKGKKVYFLYNSRPVNLLRNQKLSDILLEAMQLGSIFLKNNISCIMFCRSRKEVELLTSYLKEKNPELQHKINSYRGGYLPNERREIERKLREKEIMLVIATNALELGIDIGSLEASISVGYPGSIHSFLQQSGRAGRKAEISLSILVASQDRMDQYILRNPQFLFEKNPENVRINSDIFWIVVDHLKCSISEKPFLEEEKFGKYPNPKGILEIFLKDALVVKRENKYFWCGEEFPQNSINIRGGPKKNVTIQDITYPGSKTLGEMDYYSARLHLHSQAIYLHQGETYFVEELSLEKLIAYVKKIQTDYYTEAEEKIKIKPLFEEKKFESEKIEIYKGELRIISQPTIFKKIKFITKENIGFGEIHLPEDEMQTQGFWILFDFSFFDKNHNIGITLLSISYALSINAAVLSCSEIDDIRCVSLVLDSIYRKPTLYVYDNFPGGLEISYLIYNNLRLILEETVKSIEKCKCKVGCPACIGLSYLEDKSHNYKILSIFYLEKLLSILENS